MAYPSGAPSSGDGVKIAPVAPAPRPAAVPLSSVTATARINGTVAAQNFASLLAPRITGSRSGMNRGGTDANFGGGGGGPGGGMGGDFTLILLHLAKAGIHVKAGDVVAEFDPQFHLQRLNDYKDTVIQL